MRESWGSLPWGRTTEAQSIPPREKGSVGT
jgi:hypothetical protein